MKTTAFGTLEDGRSVAAYTLKCGSISVTLLNYGAIIQSIIIDGVDIVCGYDTLKAYQNSSGYQAPSSAGTPTESAAVPLYWMKRNISLPQMKTV